MGMTPVDPSETDRTRAAAHDAKAMGAHPPHVQRVIAERNELYEKVGKLDTFIKSNPTFNTLDGVDQVLLGQQLDHMEAYGRVLDRRLARVEPPA